MMTSRDRILKRLRVSQPLVERIEPASAPLPMVPLSDQSPSGLRALFTEQAKKLACEVHQPASEIEAVQTILNVIGKDTYVLSWALEHIPLPGLAEGFAVSGIEITHEADGSVRVGITGVDAALAATGSIVLATGVGKPRVASLLPPIHIAVVHQNQIIADLETWIALQRKRGLGIFRQTASALVISGPSRTADIAMKLILGMHGPGEVHLVILNG